MPVFKIPDHPFLFPHPDLADVDGLLGVGGDLHYERILLAYQNGIFPWNSGGEPIQWWCPTPRLILYPEKIVISKSMRRYVNNFNFQVSFDTDFISVMLQCKTAERKGQKGSWIYQDLMDTFLTLHEMGIAHSVEVWQNNELIGGLYGLAIGKIFCGESMFAKIPNASKFALIQLARTLEKMDYHFIDCQQDTPHLRSMGAEIIEKEVFFELIENNKKFPIRSEVWNAL